MSKKSFNTLELTVGISVLVVLILGGYLVFIGSKKVNDISEEKIELIEEDIVKEEADLNVDSQIEEHEALDTSKSKVTEIIETVEPIEETNVGSAVSEPIVIEDIDEFLEAWENYKKEIYSKVAQEHPGSFFIHVPLRSLQTDLILGQDEWSKANDWLALRNDLILLEEFQFENINTTLLDIRDKINDPEKLSEVVASYEETLKTFNITKSLVETAINLQASAQKLLEYVDSLQDVDEKLDPKLLERKVELDAHATEIMQEIIFIWGRYIEVTKVLIQASLDKNEELILAALFNFETMDRIILWESWRLENKQIEVEVVNSELGL